MDLDELQSVQSRERQTDSLQRLRATFYQDAAEFIHSLEDERDAAAERAEDPWNSPEVGRLNDDIDTAEGTVEAIYERRVGKIVKMASLAAADMPTDDDGLTEEERDLFETLVAAIEENRRHVFAILDHDTATQPPGSRSDASADAPAGADPGAPADANADQAPDGADADHPNPGSAGQGDSASGQGNVDAADLMGDGPEEGTDRDPELDGGSPGRGPDGGHDANGAGNAGTAASRAETAAGDGGAAGGSRAAGGSGADSGSGAAGASGRADGSGTADADTTTRSGSDVAVDRTTVRITSDVGEIFGVDERAYDLSTDDVVTLPEANATPLLDGDAAERLE